MVGVAHFNHCPPALSLLKKIFWPGGAIKRIIPIHTARHLDIWRRRLLWIELAPYEKGDQCVCHDTDIPVVVIKGDTIPQIISKPTMSFQSSLNHRVDTMWILKTLRSTGEYHAKITEFTSGTTLACRKRWFNTLEEFVREPTRDDSSRVISFWKNQPPIMVDGFLEATTVV